MRRFVAPKPFTFNVAAPVFVLAALNETLMFEVYEAGAGVNVSVSASAVPPAVAAEKLFFWISNAFGTEMPPEVEPSPTRTRSFVVSTIISPSAGVIASHWAAVPRRRFTCVVAMP